MSQEKTPEAVALAAIFSAGIDGQKLHVHLAKARMNAAQKHHDRIDRCEHFVLALCTELELVVREMLCVDEVTDQ